MSPCTVQTWPPETNSMSPVSQTPGTFPPSQRSGSQLGAPAHPSPLSLILRGPPPCRRTAQSPHLQKGKNVPAHTTSPHLQLPVVWALGGENVKEEEIAKYVLCNRVFEYSYDNGEQLLMLSPLYNFLLLVKSRKRGITHLKVSTQLSCGA